MEGDEGMEGEGTTVARKEGAEGIERHERASRGERPRGDSFQSLGAQRTLRKGLRALAYSSILLETHVGSSPCWVGSQVIPCDGQDLGRLLVPGRVWGSPCTRRGLWGSLQWAGSWQEE